MGSTHDQLTSSLLAQAIYVVVLAQTLSACWRRAPTIHNENKRSDLVHKLILTPPICNRMCAPLHLACENLYNTSTIWTRSPFFEWLHIDPETHTPNRQQIAAAPPIMHNGPSKCRIVPFFPREREVIFKFISVVFLCAYGPRSPQVFRR